MEVANLDSSRLFTIFMTAISVGYRLMQLFTKQDKNTLVNAVLCLATDVALDPNVGRLGRMLATLERLVKNAGFKAKATTSVVVGYSLNGLARAVFGKEK